MSLLEQIGKACKPTPPMLRGEKQNHYRFKKHYANGVFLVGIEFKAAWSDSIENALKQLEGDGWELVSITKHENV